MEPEGSLSQSQMHATCPYPEPARSSPSPKYQSRSEAYSMSFVTWYFFYGEQLLAPHPTNKLEEHSLSAVRDCLFNILAATLHIGGRFSIRARHL